MRLVVRGVAALVVAIMFLAVHGCATMNNTGKGAVIGATAGGTVGGVIGHQSGHTAEGVIIGAAVGGVAGGLIGHTMDKQAQELEQNIPGATVKRVGEGIQVTFASGLLFDFDSDTIRPEARHNLTALANSLDKYPKTELLIVGHTDAVGSDSYNQALSERRARSAARYLETQGVSGGRLATRGRGESEPVASNDSEAGRQDNRRVEVAIYANETLKSKAAIGTN